MRVAFIIPMKSMSEYIRLGMVYMSFVLFLAAEIGAIFYVYKVLGVI